MRWAGQFVIIIYKVEFKADATAATHEQMDKRFQNKSITQTKTTFQDYAQIIRNVSKNEP